MNIDREIDIMGIVNLTGDSYIPDSRCQSLKDALSLIDIHIREGASVIDLGACSSRPGAVPVGAEEEWRRLKPVLKAVRTELPDIRISVDTTWSDVVEKVYDTIGDFIVNDISAGEADSRMLGTVGRLGLTYVAMHMRGNSRNMQELTDYGDVVDDVLRYFVGFASKAEANGLRNWILDPGFGFSKTLEQNYELMRRLQRFKDEFPSNKLLVGISRKSMITRFLNICSEESLPATQVLHLRALENGADFLRVHDVRQASQTVALYRMLYAGNR